MDRAEKRELVAELNKVFSETSTVIVGHYSGLNVAELTQLRREMSQVGASFKVTKNRLTKLALDGTQCQPISDLFTGPTAIAYSNDPVAAAKAAVDFARKNDKFVVLGGIMAGTRLDPNGVKALATLPSLDELRARIVGMIKTPATRIAGVLQAPGGQVARVLGAYAKKGEAA